MSEERCALGDHPGEIFTIVDDANRAINGTRLCRACYTVRYGTPRKYLRPTPDDLWSMERGILGVHNLLSSGDYEHRIAARARFVVRSR